MSHGTNRVRLSFNPNGNPLVDEIKHGTADLIDLCLREVSDPEEVRLWALAQTHYEIAAMFAVKAATTGK